MKSLHPKLRISLLPLGGGILYAFGLPTTFFPHLFFFPLLGFFFLLIVLKETSLKSNLCAFFCFSLGACLLGHYWLPYTLREFGGISFPLDIILWSSFSFIIFPQILSFILLFGPLSRISGKLPLSAKNIFLSFLLTASEYYTPQLFPAHLGHAWLSLAPYLGLAPFFGVSLFSFFSFWPAFVLFHKFRSGKWDIWGVVFFVLFFGINMATPLPPPLKKGTSTTLRMVQANIEGWMKQRGKEGDPLFRHEIVERYFFLSLWPKKKLDLIIWPETAYPEPLYTSLMKKRPEKIPLLFRKITSLSGAQLIVGGYDRTDDKTEGLYKTMHNSIFYFDRNGHLKNFYHKRILMPFGEGLPLGPLNPFVARIIKNMSFFAEGKRFPLFELDHQVTFINAICYEILFSDFMRDYLNHVSKASGKNAHFILNLTNDSWYGDTSEPYQHQFLSHWRALEFQLPVVRMTNTGLSSLLYPDGSQSEGIGLFEAANRDYTLFTKAKAPTPFQRYGFFLTLSLCIVLFLLALFLTKITH